jgi:hypothetical protein
MNGVLSCIIRGIDTIGGVWKFRTTSYNSIQGITSSLFFIKQITGGPLAGIELELVLGPKTTTTPEGATQTVYVVGIEYAGNVEKLRGEGLKTLTTNVYHRKQLAAVEQEVSKMIDVEVNNVDDTVDEFYPENAEGYKEPEIDLGYKEQEAPPAITPEEATAMAKEEEARTEPVQTEQSTTDELPDLFS